MDEQLTLPVGETDWYEVPTATIDGRPVGFVRVRASSKAEAKRRALEELDNLGVGPGADPSLNAAWQRMVKYATSPKRRR